MNSVSCQIQHFALRRLNIVYRKILTNGKILSDVQIQKIYAVSFRTFTCFTDCVVGTIQQGYTRQTMQWTSEAVRHLISQVNMYVPVRCGCHDADHYESQEYHWEIETSLHTNL